MKRAGLSSIGVLLALLSFAPAAYSQALRVSVQSGEEFSTVSGGGSVTISSPGLGVPQSARVAVTNAGAGSITISGVELSGSSGFGVSAPPAQVTLGPGQSTSFGITYTPTSSGRASAQASIRYTDSAGGSGTSSFFFNIIGQAADLRLAYSLEADGNVIPLAPNSSIRFPDTPVRSGSNATILIVNRGTAPGRVRTISVTGEGFSTLGLPLLPADVAPGSELRLVVRFSPRQAGPVTGGLTIETIEGQPVNVRLEGSGVTSVLSYTMRVGDLAAPLNPGQPVVLQGARLNERTNGVFEIQNTGTTERVISALSLSGPGFELLEAPAVPFTLTPGTSIALPFVFAPTVPGDVTGRLRVGNDFLEIRTSGVGNSLRYSYLLHDVVTPVLPAGTILFPQVRLGEPSRVSFLIENIGSSPATITSIAIAEGGSAFRIDPPPPTPLVLAPRETARIQLIYVPESGATATSTLRIDTATFTLTANSAPPPGLPSYSFEGPSGQIEALQQIPYGLRLSQPYPLPIRGTIALQFSSDAFADDPAVQFASGGRTATFTIPANATEAIFPNGTNRIRLQTGSVVGAITLSATFQTERGGVDIVANSPTQLTLTTPPAAPRLLGMQISPQGTAGIALIITGISTPRDLRQLDFDFTIDPEFASKFSSNRYSANIEQIAGNWFRSPDSSAFGSTFQITVPLAFQGATVSYDRLIRAISVTAVNSVGTSQPLRVDIPTAPR